VNMIMIEKRTDLITSPREITFSTFSVRTCFARSGNDQLNVRPTKQFNRENVKY